MDFFRLCHTLPIPPNLCCELLFVVCCHKLNFILRMVLLIIKCLYNSAVESLHEGRLEGREKRPL